MKQDGTRKKQIPPDKIAAKQVYSVPIGAHGNEDREIQTEKNETARPRTAGTVGERATPRMGRDALHAPC